MGKINNFNEGGRMKKLVILAVALGLLTAAGSAIAGAKWPDKGWHKGFYFGLGGGLMQATNDKHVVTGRTFDGSVLPAFGLTLGYDILDWIGPQLTATFATGRGQVGTATGAAGTFGPGTFPLENAREYAANIGLYVRATAPYFVDAGWQHENFKFIPYAKLGGIGHGLYVNAHTPANKTGAYGGGLGGGLGIEMFIWKGIDICIDATENVIFQGSYYRTISGTRTKVIEGGTKAQFNLLGTIGYHF